MLEFDSTQGAGGRLRIIGVGGAGTAIVDHLLGTGEIPAEAWVCNTDAQALGTAACRNRLQIGRTLTRGLGAGGNAETGRLAAEEDLDSIRRALDGAELLLVAAGLGGGVGSGATPVILREARAIGIVTVAVVTTPFRFEGERRASQAREAAEVLREAADTLVLLPSELFLEKTGAAAKVQETFEAADVTLAGILRSLSEIVSGGGPIGLDLSDVRSVFSQHGRARLGLGTGRGPNAASEAAGAALTSRFLDGVSLNTAGKILLHVRGCPSISLSEATEIVVAVSDATAGNADLFWSLSVDDALVDEVQVTLIATGFTESSPSGGILEIADSDREAPPHPPRVDIDYHIDAHETPWIDPDLPSTEPAEAGGEDLLPTPPLERKESWRSAPSNHPRSFARRRESRQRQQASDPWGIYPVGVGPPTVPSGDSPKLPSTALGDPVDCTVFAPPKARIGQTVLVQVFAHLVEAAKEVESLAHRFDERTDKRGFTSLRADVPRGSALTFHLTSSGAQIDEPIQTVLWRGRTAPVDFSLTMPQTSCEDPLIAKLVISQNFIPLGQIAFAISLLSPSRGSEDAEPRPVGTAKRYEYVFVSYASEDRTEVLKRVQMLRSLGISYFQDSLSIRTGAEWAREIRQSIALADLFLLFWSSAAKSSEWVRQEIRLALDRKAGVEVNPPEIMPVILEGPPIPEPPEELRHIQFSDSLVYFMNR